MPTEFDIFPFFKKSLALAEEIIPCFSNQHASPTQIWQACRTLNYIARVVVNWTTYTVALLKPVGTVVPRQLVTGLR